MSAVLRRVGDCWIDPSRVEAVKVEREKPRGQVYFVVLYVVARHGGGTFVIRLRERSRGVAILVAERFAAEATVSGGNS